MLKRYLLIAALFIIIFGFLLRLYPIRNNNFYFTMDQGNVAVRSREVWFKHRPPLIGEDTSIKGVYHGPGYIWYVAVAYFIAGGHPVAPVILQILLNLAISLLLLRAIAKNISPTKAIITVLSLQLFWPFFETSRFSFNPFPSVAVTIATILFLITVIGGKTKIFIAAAATSGLLIHTEIASYLPPSLLWISVGLIQLYRKRLSLTTFLIACAVHGLFFVPHLISEITSGFSQSHALLNQFTAPDSNLNNQNFVHMAKVFEDLLADSLIPASGILSTLVLVGALVAVGTSRLNKKFTHGIDKFTQRFFILTMILFALSFLYFSTNSGWNPWHTLYIPPLIFISTVLIILTLEKKLATILLLIIFILQLNVFLGRYQESAKLSSDASILRNELAAIDFIYQKADGKGFYAYTYLPSVYDYPYQYLFWWYGRKKYQYVPCEYTTYPDIPDFFVPHYNDYQEPKRECQRVRFLIIEPDEKEFLRQKWIDQLTKNTTLVEETKVGNITVQKRTF